MRGPTTSTPRSRPGRCPVSGCSPGRTAAGRAPWPPRSRSAPGSAPAYRPTGSFEARTQLTDDGADLWVRYLDQASRDFRESIASGLTEDFAAFSRRLDAAITDTTRSNT
ncbi:hypothetical protein [Streptomyces canus]|uniref:hypothetical protein n=1 Tax=Streptomyces canus TaxID=58343 RepID=UPI003CF172A9